MFEYNSYQNIMISMYYFVFHRWSVKEKCKMFVAKTWPTQKLKTNNLEKSWRWNNEKGRMEIKSRSFQNNLERTSSQFRPGQSCWPNAIFSWKQELDRETSRMCLLIKYSDFVSILNFPASTNWNWKTLIFQE